MRQIIPKNLEIVIHIGAPHSDYDQLTWSLRKDNELMAEHGVLLRRPSKYRNTVGAALDRLAGEVASGQDQETLLKAVLRNFPANRLILSNSEFMGAPELILNGGGLFQNAGKNTQALRNLFPDYACRFCLEIVNPATLLPNTFELQSKNIHEDLFGNEDVLSMRWSDVIKQILTCNPGCRITVWCKEDAPLIWPAILSAVTGINSHAGFFGAQDLVEQNISKEGWNKLSDYLAKHPDLDKAQRQRVRKIFLKHFPKKDAAEGNIGLPGWIGDIVQTMTEIYENDIERIRNMPSVDFISA